MTNKEVIEQLKWVKKRICDITYSPESFEALNLAIKKFEERTQGDLISREALKEAFEDCSGECACCVHNTNDFEYCGLIDDAPSVKPCDNCDLYFIAKTKEEMRKGGAE